MTTVSDRVPKSVTFDRNHRSRCFGIPGHLQSESSVTLLRNHRSRSIGIRGHLGPEYAFDISNELTIDTDRLFENLERLWIALGRQPTKRDLGTSQSEFSDKPYSRAFGSWRKALQAFVDWANADDTSSLHPDTEHPTGNADEAMKATPRDPNLRTRFLVMKRDGFRCRYCGKSPATDAGVELVLDHVHPWSKGGKTTMDNLATSCVPCNAGKSNT